jgi:UPI0001AE6F0C related cluster
MFKKLFEGMAADENIIKLNITDMANDYPEVDYNELRDRLTDAGAVVDGQVGNGTIQEDGNGDMNVYMLVSGVDMATVEDAVEEIVSEYEGVDGVDATEYLASNNITGVEDTEDLDDDSELDLDVEDEDSDDLDDDTYNLGDNSEFDVDDDDNEDTIDLDDEDIVEAVKRATSKVLKEHFANVRRKKLLKEHRELHRNDRRSNRFFVEGRLNEASTMNVKKGCCPGKNRRVNLLESLKAQDETKQEKLDNSVKSIKDVIDSVKGHSIGAQEVKDAFAKLKKEQKALSKIEKNDKGDKFALTDVNGAAGALKKMKESDPSQADAIDKFQKSLKESVFNALNAKKKSLHGKVSVNGQLLESMSNTQVSTLLTKVNAAKNKLVNKLSNSLNESLNTKNNIKNEIVKLTKLSNILDEENTYRTYATKYGLINEDENQDAGNSGEFSEEDLANMFGAGQGEETKSDNETEEKTEEPKSEDAQSEDTQSDEDSVEEVELARIVITMQDKDAAEDLKASCVNAGIPEDVIEITDDTEDEPEEKEEGETSTEDKDDDKADASEESKDTNEGVKYSNLRRLFEADEENSEEKPEDAPEENSDETDDADAESEGHTKFILTNTDYALQLSKVLDDVYGITKEEFEDMIGGEIVEDSDEDDATEDKDSDENTTDADNTEGSTEEDTIDPSELFKGM